MASPSPATRKLLALCCLALSSKKSQKSKHSLGAEILTLHPAGNLPTHRLKSTKQLKVCEDGIQNSQESRTFGPRLPTALRSKLTAVQTDCGPNVRGLNVLDPTVRAREKKSGT